MPNNPDAQQIGVVLDANPSGQGARNGINLTTDVFHGPLEATLGVSIQTNFRASSGFQALQSFSKTRPRNQASLRSANRCESLVCAHGLANHGIAGEITTPEMGARSVSTELIVSEPAPMARSSSSAARDCACKASASDWALRTSCCEASPFERKIIEPI